MKRDKGRKHKVRERAGEKEHSMQDNEEMDGVEVERKHAAESDEGNQPA